MLHICTVQQQAALLFEGLECTFLYFCQSWTFVSSGFVLNYDEKTTDLSLYWIYGSENSLH